MRTSPLVALLLVAAGCDAWLTKPNLYNSVTVVVSQRNGAPVPGAGLSLYTGQRPMGYATTGSDGRYVFRDVPQGNYGVFATPPDGYDVLEHLIQAPSSIVHDGLVVANDTLSPVRFTFLKRGPGTVSVHVADVAGGDLSGVSLTLYDPQAVDGKAVTDASGRATFTNVTFGLHGVLVERPLLYRDYLAPGDSLYSHKDNLIIDDGAADTATFQFKRCGGTMRAVLLDDVGSPVPNAAVLFYTSTLQLSVATSGPTGIVLFAGAPCATQLGMYITPGPGYTIGEGRGSRFIDGLTVANGATVQATFRLHKLP